MSHCKHNFRFLGVGTVLTVLASLSGFVLGCGGGTILTGKQQTGPANLTYPQTSINATVGTAVETDIPTVTGTVTSYSVAPALPSGLGLNGSSGAISGTPSAQSAEAGYTITASNSAGSTTATIQISVSQPGGPPSGLTYPQTSINATVGTAIETDIPTVTGTVSSWSVAPALPAGLSLNTSSGAISGAPTAQSASASYIVTASNPVGSTTATIQISVVQPVTPPSNLSYPQTSLTLEVGQSFESDVPTYSGTVTSFSISPALPAGINLDPGTGAIYGVPSSSASSATYAITASNAGGSTTATVTLVVGPALVTLLNLGSARQIIQILPVGSNVLTLDQSGHWVLLDYSSGTEIATSTGQVQGPEGGNFTPIETGGTIFVVAVTNGLEVRSTTDGHLISIISFSPISAEAVYGWNVASDGSYICAGTADGLLAWSPTTGKILMTQAAGYGDLFAAPGQILVGNGPAGAVQNVIETVSVPDGTTTVGPLISGNFYTWSSDGSYFVTNLDDEFWIYNAAGTLQNTMSFPALTTVGIDGDWLWAWSEGGTASTLNVYPVGSSTRAGSYMVSPDAQMFVSGNTIGLVTTESSTTSASAVEVIDLSGATPVETSYSVPPAGNNIYGAFGASFGALSASQWLVGNAYGVLLDGGSLSSTVRYLSQGTAFDITGSSSVAAVSVANGNIYIFDPANTTPQQTISFPSNEVALSADGTVLAAAYVPSYIPFVSPGQNLTVPNQVLNIYSLPAGTLTYSWDFPNSTLDFLLEFSLATSGSNIGVSTEGGTIAANTYQFDREVTAVTGGPVIWSDTFDGDASEYMQPPLLSPNGDYIAAPAFNNDTTLPVALTYQNSTALAQINGYAVGWLDESDLLVNNYYLPSKGGAIYQNATIYSPDGSAGATIPLPELQSFQVVSSGLIYSPDTNAIYSTTTGSATWTSSYPSEGVGATAAGEVVFLSGARVVVQSQ
jgi:Putative Ig domain